MREHVYKHPVYIVISQHQYNARAQWMAQWGLPHTILAVYRCDTSEIEDVWRGQASQLAQLPGAQSVIYSAPPDDPFKGLAKSEPEPETPAGWLPGDETKR